MARKKIFDIFPPEKITEGKIKKVEPSIKVVKKGIFKKGLIFAFLFFILFGIIGYFALAKVEVEIWPETEILNFEKKITADIETFQVDYSKGIIPATAFEVEENASQEFPSSGKVEKKAEGTIRVYNNYHLLVTLRSGTRFQPPLEEVLYFCSPQKIVIQAKSYVDVRVIACRPGEGEKYNIRPSKFSVPGLQGTDLFFYIYGESFQSMEGGGTISQVTEDDLERAKNILNEQLFTKLSESLGNILQTEALRLNKDPTDFILLENAIQKEVLETSPGAEVGAEVPSFDLQVRVRADALVFKKSDLKNFAKEFILTQIPKDKKLKEESLNIDPKVESIDLELGKIVLNLKFSAIIYSDLNFTLLKESLKGKSLEESKIILENQGEIIRVRITAWPFWVKEVPQDVKKIELKINIDTSAGAQY